MSTRNIRKCLDGIGLDQKNPFSECNNLQEEFNIIKKCYFKSCLKTHPDKGGSAEEFREVNDSFESLRQIFEKARIKSFATAQSESAQAEYTSSRSRSENNFTPNSWEFYEEAGGEAIPLYNVERAKSSRSTCAQTTKSARKCPAKDSNNPATLIEKGELRVGTMDMMSGSYARFSHIKCWRVASRVWLGLPDPDLCQERAKFDEALVRMNTVTLTGYSNLNKEERDLIIDHVMDKSHWAKLVKRKAKSEPLAIENSIHLQSQSESKPQPQQESNEALAKREPLAENAIAILRPPSNQVAMAKPRFEMPLVNAENRHFLSGQTVVLTGVFPEVGGGAGLNQGKDRVRAMVEQFGGRVTSAISGKTDLLIVGKEPGFSKVSKARIQPRCRLMSIQDLTLAIGSNDMDAIENPAPLTIDSSAFSTGYFGTSNLAIGASTEQMEIAQGLRAAPLMIKKGKGMKSDAGNELVKKKASKKRPPPPKEEKSSGEEESENNEDSLPVETKKTSKGQKAVKRRKRVVEDDLESTTLAEEPPLQTSGTRRSRRRIAAVAYCE